MTALMCIFTHIKILNSIPTSVYVVQKTPMNDDESKGVFMIVRFVDLYVEKYCFRTLVKFDIVALVKLQICNVMVTTNNNQI